MSVYATVQLRRLCRIRNGADYKQVEDPDGPYPVYGSGGAFSQASQYLYRGPAVLLGRKGTVDRPLLVDGKYWTVDTMFCAQPEPDVDVRFLYYACTTIPFGLLSTSTALPSMTQGDLNAVILPGPAREVQSKVANFLDRETAKIDALIAKQEQLIATLQEDRSATIVEWITGGADPNRDFKSSGVPWLRDIPVEWDVVASRRMFKLVKQRASIDDQALTASQEYGVVPQSLYTERTGNRVTQVILNPDILWHVEPGDFVISMRSFQGGLEYSAYSGCISSAYVILRPTVQIESVFFRYAFKCTTYIQQLQSTSNLVRDGQALRFENFAMVALPQVPLAEQQQISRLLDERCEEIAKLIEKSQLLIDTLREYRAALITDAVTGKIDVREMV